MKRNIVRVKLVSSMICFSMVCSSFLVPQNLVLASQLSNINVVEDEQALDTEAIVSEEGLTEEVVEDETTEDEPTEEVVEDESTEDETTEDDSTEEVVEDETTEDDLTGKVVEEEIIEELIPVDSINDIQVINEDNLTLKYLVFDKDTHTITDYKENVEAPKDVVIPAEIEGVPVEYIGKEAFFGNNLTSFTVEGNNLKEIGEKAFYNNKNLKTVNIPDSVTKIGISSFEECVILDGIKLTNVTEIGDRAFYNAKKLPNVDLTNVLTIGKAAFYNAVSLTEINIPNVTVIERETFYGCTGLTSLDLPQILEIKESAFAKCTGIQSINLENVTSILDGGFEDNTSLAEINIPKVTVINARVFKNADKIVSLDMPNIVEVKDSGFDNCDSLETVTMENVIKLGNSAFNNNGVYKLHTIYMPNVEEIGISTFVYCRFKFVNGKENVIYFPKVEIIGDSAFSSVGQVTTGIDLEFPEVKELQSYAFSRTRFKNIDMPKLEKIGNNAFAGYDSFSYSGSGQTEFVLPETVKEIGTEVFRYSSIKSIDFNNNQYITELPYHTFYGAIVTGGIKNTDNIKTIGEEAFYRASVSGELEFNNVSKIADKAFKEVKKLKTISIGSQTEEPLQMGENVFFDYDDLTTVTLNKVANIPESTFKVTSIISRDKLTAINIKSMEKDSIANAPWGAEWADVFWKDEQVTNAKRFFKDNVAYCVQDDGSLNITHTKMTSKVEHLEIQEKIVRHGVTYVPKVIESGANLSYVISITGNSIERVETKNIGGNIYISGSVDGFAKLPNATYIDKEAFGLEGQERKIIKNVYVNNREKDSIANAPWGAKYANIHWENAEDGALRFEVNNIIYEVIRDEDEEPRVFVADNTFEQQEIQENVTIPTTIKNGDKEYTVVEIGKSAFKYSYIKNITLPNTITKIGEEAFYSSGYLENVYFEDNISNVTEVGRVAFYNCKKLVNFTVGNLELLGSSSFYETQSLEEIKVTGGESNTFPYLKEIPRTVFYNSAITSFKGENVETLGYKAFFNSLVETVDLPSLIEVQAQQETTSNSTLYSSAFESCTQLKVVNIPLLEETYGKLFKDCFFLEEVNAKSLKNIGANAFENVGGKAKIGKNPLKVDAINVENIDEKAFANSDITEVNFPNVTNIGREGFLGTKLDKVSFPVLKKIDYMTFAKTTISQIDLPNLEYLGSYSFEGSKNLKELYLPSVTTMSSSAFWGDDTERKYYLPKLTGVPSNAFYKAAISEIYIPEVTYIGESAFRDCKGLKEIYLPKVTTVGKYAFKNCQEIKEIDMPSLDTIEINAFESSSIQKINIPYVRTIKDGAFKDCKNLEDIKLPSYVKIGLDVFDSNTVIKIDRNKDNYYDVNYGKWGGKTTLYRGHYPNFKIVRTTMNEDKTYKITMYLELLDKYTVEKLKYPEIEGVTFSEEDRPSDNYLDRIITIDGIKSTETSDFNINALANNIEDSIDIVIDTPIKYHIDNEEVFYRYYPKGFDASIEGVETLNTEDGSPISLEGKKLDTWRANYSIYGDKTFKANETYKIDRSIDLYPNWIYDEYTVNYKTNVDEVTIDSEVVSYGSKITIIPNNDNLVKEGYTLDGWYVEGTNQKWNFGKDVVTKDITLYAKWNSIYSSTTQTPDKDESIETTTQETSKDESVETTTIQSTTQATSKDESTETTTIQSTTQTTSKDESVETTNKDESVETTTIQNTTQTPNRDESVETTTIENTTQTSNEDESIEMTTDNEQLAPPILDNNDHIDNDGNNDGDLENSGGKKVNNTYTFGNLELITPEHEQMAREVISKIVVDEEVVSTSIENIVEESLSNGSKINEKRLTEKPAFGFGAEGSISLLIILLLILIMIIIAYSIKKQVFDKEKTKEDDDMSFNI